LGANILNQFAQLIGECVVLNNGAVRGAGTDTYPLIGDTTLANIAALPRLSGANPQNSPRGAVVFMTKKVRDPNGRMNAYRFDYIEVMNNDYSDSAKVTSVVPSQISDYVQYNEKPSTARPSMHGFWMTLTGGNVQTNSGKLFDAGKYGMYVPFIYI
jgi:hypothetical protein